jgi:outer membrane autotransporter protein
MQGRCEQNVTPAAWARGSAGWFNLQDKATTTSSGRTYHYDLEREFDLMNFESGFDFGKQDLLAPGDLLIFGVLGGFVHAQLDYENLARKLNVSGGEAGAYATYLRGGFFFDTLFKGVFLEHDFREGIGFPDDFGGNVYGLRSDTGYRFGGFRKGPFIEPLATIAVSWSDLEDFTIGGNRVNFGDDANVRGRVGLRLGTSTRATESVLMEPFIVGSLWGTLSGSHSASLTSAGETFTFTDEPEDLWGVVSAGVNFFNFTSNTTVFAKVDVTFGDDLDGVGGKAGMRVAW